jgi:Cu-processing system permease protein
MIERPLIIIARTEFSAASRLWWIRLFTVAYALLTMSMAQAATVTGDSAAHETFARLTVALLPLALMLVTLAALLVGVSSISSEQDAGGFLLTQPVSRVEVLVGRWLGQAGALCAALVGGFAAGGVVVWANTGGTDIYRFVLLVCGCALLALAFLSVSTLLAACTSSRGTALGIAVFIWFVVVILYDAAALAATLWLTGRTGTRLLFGSVFGNAVDLVRILVLSMAGTPHILGVAGESWMRMLGGPMQSALLSALTLTLWIATPLVIAARVFSRRDL